MSNEAAREKTTNELAVERTDMASDRTRWAADRTLWADDRTLIAWIRTSLALIGFGFGVGRALEYLEKFDRKTDPYHSAMIFGASFIFLGVVGLLGARCVAGSFAPGMDEEPGLAWDWHVTRRRQHAR